LTWRPTTSPVAVCLLEREADWTVLPVAVFPVGNYLPGGGAVRHCARLAGLAGCHVVEDVLHGAAVGERALAHLLSLRLLLLLFSISPLTLVRVQQEDQLLLDQLPLFWVC